MAGASKRLTESIRLAVRRVVAAAGTVTGYRQPLVAFADAQDSRFAEMRRRASPDHLMPRDLLREARSVVVFFIPFRPDVVTSNARDDTAVATQWALAYVETNSLLGRVTAHLEELLAEQGYRGVAQPATDNFDPVSLTSRWSHKSAAVIAGLGSFGLHQMVITDAGCAGRFGSIVTDADLPSMGTVHKERCLYFHDGSCLACIARCPVDALSATAGLDRDKCWSRCQEVARGFEHLGAAEVCGKCVIGPCAFESPV